ncbi:cystathionine gamma-synthase family protein [Maridesulfovibrio bastinii]|uniref:cystathionine gamma-synthase family protein n=1 Tax=Maridesulfovibrio bastinii TaxID=47157 RepID=UPI0003FD9F2B|nr:cystathionine gamma-synthase family protein [Maridesulfovibrio bastinii]
MSKTDCKLGTKTVWAGEDRLFEGNATQTPVVHSVSFGYDDMEQWMDVALGKQAGHIYSRNTNPTVSVFEEKLRQLEGGEAATSASTGMAIISNTLFSLLAPGDRVVSVKDTYGGTNRLFTEFLPRQNVNVTLCETEDFDAIEAEVAKGCKILYLETPTNPTIKILDLERLAKAGKAAGAIVIVDNTFATPINQNPLKLGADLVLHSATKYLSGHADALGGIITGSKELISKIYAYREIVGGTMHPMAAYLMIRGMKTLKLRVEKQNENAMEIAKFLENHPGVERVFYPGLENHPGHDVAVKQMSGFGGMLSFMVKGNTYEDACRCLTRLKIVRRAANLGSVETIAGPPATTSHVECTAEERAAMGIPESLIRYSVGIEDVEDLKADLDQALS